MASLLNKSSTLRLGKNPDRETRAQEPDPEPLARRVSEPRFYPFGESAQIKGPVKNSFDPGRRCRRGFSAPDDNPDRRGGRPPGELDSVRPSLGARLEIGHDQRRRLSVSLRLEGR